MLLAGAVGLWLPLPARAELDLDPLNRFKELFAAHEKAGQSELWDLHVDDKIPSAPYRRIHFGEV